MYMYNFHQYITLHIDIMIILKTSTHWVMRPSKYGYTVLLNVKT